MIDCVSVMIKKPERSPLKEDSQVQEVNPHGS